MGLALTHALSITSAFTGVHMSNTASAVQGKYVCLVSGYYEELSFGNNKNSARNKKEWSNIPKVHFKMGLLPVLGEKGKEFLGSEQFTEPKRLSFFSLSHLQDVVEANSQYLSFVPDPAQHLVGRFVEIQFNPREKYNKWSFRTIKILETDLNHLSSGVELRKEVVDPSLIPQELTNTQEDDNADF
jgi:hypothetical protein